MKAISYVQDEQRRNPRPDQVFANQVSAVEAYCESIGAELVAHFVEDPRLKLGPNIQGKSYGKGSRPAFDEAWQTLLTTDVDLIIIGSYGRLATYLVTDLWLKRAIRRTPKRMVRLGQFDVLTREAAASFVNAHDDDLKLWNFVWGWYDNCAKQGFDTVALDQSIQVIESVWKQRKPRRTKQGKVRTQRSQARKSSVKLEQYDRELRMRNQLDGWYSYKRPYEYDLIDGRLVLNVERWRVIRTIHRLAKWARMSSRRIADWLNGDNKHGWIFPSPGVVDRSRTRTKPYVYDPPPWNITSVARVRRQMQNGLRYWAKANLKEAQKRGA